MKRKVANDKNCENENDELTINCRIKYNGYFPVKMRLTKWIE